MGSGSSKTKTKDRTPKDVDKNTTPKRRKSTAKSRNESLLAPEHRQPPKGMRRNSDGRRSRTGAEGEGIHSDFVPYEAEKLDLTGNWELEAGADEETLMTDISYPPPRAGRPAADRTALQRVDFAVIHKNLSSPVSTKGTFKDVACQVVGDVGPEICRVRALTTWIAGQKVRSRQYGQDAKPDTVLSYMKQIKEQKGTFQGLLTNLCRAIDIPCVIIRGVYKSASHVVGEDDVRESRCTWNAVFVDGGWQLVHPFLICTPLATKSPALGWTLLESSREEVSQSVGAVLNNFFFAPKPSDFVRFCFPDESKWQLLEEKVTYSTFIKFPFLRSAFYESGMHLKSETKSVLVSEAGKCSIRIQSPQESVGRTELMYELYSGDTDPDIDQEMGHMVLCGRNEDTWNVMVQFPVDGTFKLCLFARIESWFFWIGDFKIICDVPCSNFVSQPEVPGEVGFGPSVLSENAGLLSPSHEGGIIFYRPKEEHIIKFLTIEKILLKHEIECSDADSGELHQYCRMRQGRSEVEFMVCLPRPGQFALRIYKVDENGEATNVINYLFTDDDQGRARENVFQRKARWKLREATAGRDIEPLDKALDKYIATKLEPDDDFLRGQRRLKYLRLKKGLRDGRMRRHEGTLAKAVEEAEQSQFRHALQPNIARARELLTCLEGIEISCHAVRELDHTAVSEIANFNSPPKDVHNTMVATYMLLGEDKRDLQRWGYIQGLLRRRGRESIIQRIGRFQEEVVPDRATVQAVHRIHDSVPKPYIVSASLAAAAFYNWVSDVLSHLNNVSKNATDPDDDESFETIDGNFNMNSNKQSAMTSRDDVGNMSQDEGFLDGQDTDSDKHAR